MFFDRILLSATRRYPYCAHLLGSEPDRMLRRLPRMLKSLGLSLATSLFRVRTAAVPQFWIAISQQLNKAFTRNWRKLERIGFEAEQARWALGHGFMFAQLLSKVGLEAWYAVTRATAGALRVVSGRRAERGDGIRPIQHETEYQRHVWTGIYETKVMISHRARGNAQAICRWTSTRELRALRHVD